MHPPQVLAQTFTNDWYLINDRLAQYQHWRLSFLATHDGVFYRWGEDQGVMRPCAVVQCATHHPTTFAQAFDRLKHLTDLSSVESVRASVERFLLQEGYVGLYRLHILQEILLYVEDPRHNAIDRVRLPKDLETTILDAQDLLFWDKNKMMFFQGELRGVLPQTQHARLQILQETDRLLAPFP